MIVRKYRLKKKSIIKYTFLLVSDNVHLIMMLKSCAFYFRVEIPYQQFLIYLSFMNTFLEATVRRRSSQVFPVNIEKFLRTAFL